MVICALSISLNGAVRLLHPRATAAKTGRATTLAARTTVRGVGFIVAAELACLGAGVERARTVLPSAAVAFRTGIIHGFAVLAFLLTVGASLPTQAAGPPPTSAGQVQKENAQQKYNVGVRLFRARQHRDALKW